MVVKLKYLVFFLVLIINLNGFGQITSSGVFSEPTEYSDSVFIFVFCTDIENEGNLIAEDTTGFGGYDFEWYKFNETTKDFSDLITENITINNDSTSSIITKLSNGGYKVVLTNVDKIQEYIAWVYNNNDISVEIQFHDENDCDYLALKANPYYGNNSDFDTPLNYYDTISHTLKNEIDSYEWTSIPEMDNFRSYDGPFTSIGEDATDNDSELPTENTTFSVTVTDRFGCKTEDDIEYTAIETDADFSWTAIDNKTNESSSGDSEADLSGAAPLLVRFVNESLNGQNYTWVFGDTLWNNDVDTIKTDNYLLEPEHTYYYTIADSGKTYVLRLYSESEYGCRDSIFFNINVEPSVIEFPNVFTPNDDGVNDEFVLTDFKSIRSFRITIFNRTGQVVHEFEGDALDWEGWKGKVRDSNRDAPAGNYFFVVEVTGWDNVNYNNKNLGKRSSDQGTGNEGSQTSSSGTGNQFGVVRLFR